MGRGTERSLGRRFGALASITAALVLGLGGSQASALAPITVGSTFPPVDLNCAARLPTVQAPIGAAAGYQVPVAGLITSWSFQAASNDVPFPGEGVVFVVVRPNPGANFQSAQFNGSVINPDFEGAANYSFSSWVPGALNTYPTEVAVQPGDLIGIESNGGVNCGTMEAKGLSAFYTTPQIPESFNQLPNTLMDVSASLQIQTCAGKQATLVGTSQRDVLVGTSKRDVVAAGSGDDKVVGAGGNDLICGGPGDDTLAGGTQRDVLVGGSGDDKLSGGKHGDRCLGGKGNDKSSCEVERGI